MRPLHCWLALALSGAAAADPSAILVAFGADPTRSATISFASNTSAAAYVTVSPGVGRVPAPAYDNSYANSAGLAVVYRAPLAALQPSTTYTYTCTVGGATSSPRTFTTLSADPADVPIVMYWGDLGRDGGGQAFPALEAEAARTARREPGAASVAIQAGDFACACRGLPLRCAALRQVMLSHAHNARAQHNARATRPRRPRGPQWRSRGGLYGALLQH